MKGPVTKFVAFAFVGLLAIAGFKADSHLFCDKAETVIAEAEGVNKELVMDFAEDKLKKQQQEKESNDAFKFPNVFDALRFIF